MYQALARARGSTDDWRPVTFSGLNFYSDSEEQLLKFTIALAAKFGNLEYKVEKVNE